MVQRFRVFLFITITSLTARLLNTRNKNWSSTARVSNITTLIQTIHSLTLAMEAHSFFSSSSQLSGTHSPPRARCRYSATASKLVRSSALASTALSVSAAVSMFTYLSCTSPRVHSSYVRLPSGVITVHLWAASASFFPQPEKKPQLRGTYPGV